MKGHRSLNRNVEFYEQLAPIYDRLYADVDAEEAVRQWSILLRRCAHLPNPKHPDVPRLLDLGCGTGRYLEPWAAAGFCLTGVDASKRMITIARHRLRRSEWPSRIHLVCADLRERNARLERQGPFDVAVAHFNFLNLFPLSELESILAAIAPCLRTGARLFTDCAPPQLLPTAAVEEIVLDGETRVKVSTRPNPERDMVIRSYRLGSVRTAETYWLHSPRALKAAAAAAGWRVESTFAWRPNRPLRPWRQNIDSADHRVYVLRAS